MTLPSDEPRGSHWTEHAATWSHFGSPLRPHARDMAKVQAWCTAQRSGKPAAPLNALLLGVTPEYALLPWPQGTTLTAVDRCSDMIAKVWPAPRLPASFKAVQGLWTNLPLADGSINLAMGDGISTVLPHWSMMAQITDELHRVCAPGATVILRLFTQPEAPDSLHQLMDDLEVGRIQSFHAFKLRLLMLLQASLDEGVKPRHAWQLWHALRRQHANAIAARHWAPEAMATIEAYAQSDDTYWFPTVRQALQLLERRFELKGIDHSDVELGDRCPLFLLTRSA